MCHLGVNQLITVYHFSLLCEMDESSSRFRIPKSSNEEKASIINSVPKSTVYKNKWAIQIFRELQGQRANKICTIEPGGVFKGEDIGLDVQELTESIESKGVKLMLVVWLKFIDCIWVFVIFLVKWTKHFTLGPRRIV